MTVYVTYTNVDCIKRDWVNNIAYQLLKENSGWHTLDVNFEGNIDPSELNRWVEGRGLKPGDIVIYQTPLYNFNLDQINEPGKYYFEELFVQYLRSYGCIMVGFHHDFIPFYRKGKHDKINSHLIPLSYSFDYNLIQKSMADVAENQYGLENVYPFEYHMPENRLIKEQPKEWTGNRIVYFGNLDKFANGIEKLQNENIDIDFYGISRYYHNPITKGPINGILEQQKILSQYDYGLVWDDSDVAGPNINEYSKYNFPAKLSSYLTSGIPVIVDAKNHYIANFVRKYDIGLAIDSLDDLSNIGDQSQWERQRSNIFKNFNTIEQEFVKSVQSAISDIVEKESI